MQAVILAGGLGMRLRPLTEQTAKAMILVSGKPFLLYLLELLKAAGVSDVVLCIGYLGKQIKDFFGNGKNLSIKIKYSEETGQLLGTGGALKQVQNLLDDHFFVINGDTYLPVNYNEVEETFISRGKKALMVIYDNREGTGVRNNVGVGSDFMVMCYEKESTAPDLRYVEAGVLALSRNALDLIEEGRQVSLEKGLYPFLIQQRELAAYVTEQRFYDIGTPEQHQTLEAFLKRRAK